MTRQRDPFRSDGEPRLPGDGEQAWVLLAIVLVLIGLVTAAAVILIAGVL